ncbi:MAG: NAD(P)/FAD-dependent oxidoreductase [Nocardioides sp.]|nr:NAD(P)/FAD-dependent oxidoreductase [Nocardioides sp.]
MTRKGHAVAETVEADLLIVGAGPAGLYGAYYAGFRELKVAVVDSLPELGGQVTAMYPEKAILDVAGFPTIKGRELVANLVEQAATAAPTYLLGRTAIGVEHRGDRVRVLLDDETVVDAGAVILTAGIGRFQPRGLPAGEDWEGRGLAFFVPKLDVYAGQDVVVVGGGDSAFDWAHHLEPIAKSVTLVHRRTAFRAHASTVTAVQTSSVEIVTPATVTALLPGEDGALAEIEVTDADSGETHRRPAQAVIAALGFLADLGPLKEWGLDLDKRHILVDPAMRTNLPRVYAAGDVTEYPGKVRLIAVGFGEVATAVNNAAVDIDPDAHVFPGHSSEGS